MAVTPSLAQSDPGIGGAISISKASKLYDPRGARVLALEDCSLEIPAGGFVAIVGPSGCGKSTLLNIIAGFDHLTAGHIDIDAERVADEKRSLRPASDRTVVFQNGALFPWKTVLDNIAYGPTVQHRLSRSEGRGRAEKLLVQTLGSAKIGSNYPPQLSSGMQRRVEILRALINNPRILLLDEPFRAMDTVSKSNMHQYLLDVYDKFPKTVFFITHDLDEAIYLADSVAVMTTRPGTIMLSLDVDLPRPRVRSMVTSEAFRALKQRLLHAVHEEARKAFQRGERELA